MPQKKFIAPKIICSHDGKKKVTLCKTMEKEARQWGLPVSGRRAKGIYIASNMVHIPTDVTYNKGIVLFADGNKNGVYLNFCPWCGSDLIENWMNPALKEATKKIEAKQKKTKRATKKKTTTKRSAKKAS